MKYLLMNIMLIYSLNVFAQEALEVSLKNSKTLISAINDRSIQVPLEIDFIQKPFEDFRIDVESFDLLNSSVKAKLISQKYKNLVGQGEQVNMNVGPKHLVFEISNVSEELIKLLKDSIADIYIQTNQAIIFKALKNDDPLTLKTFKIGIAQIEMNTRYNNFHLTEAMAKELIDARGRNIFLTQNQINFGVVPAEQTSSKTTEYNISFKYISRYSFLKETPIFFTAEGLIGTNSHDSLNYISIYPINYNFLNRSHELVGQIGIEGNQVFSDYRIAGNFYWNGIIPNLVDFTLGEDRLRLKPVIKVGLKLYKEIENTRPIEMNGNEFSNQIYSEFYYYIPIKKIYSINMEGSFFYDFNSKVNPAKKVMFNYSIIFGIDIPKTDFKPIFKYIKGENGITYQKNDYYMIGLMMDLFSKK